MKQTSLKENQMDYIVIKVNNRVLAAFVVLAVAVGASFLSYRTGYKSGVQAALAYFQESLSGKAFSH